MNKKISLGAAVTFCAIVAAITFAITWMASSDTFDGLVSNLTQRDEIYQKMDEIDKYVRTNYLNQNEVDDQALQDSIATGYLAGLGDKYAAYYTADSLKQKELDSKGVMVGIGVTASEDESGYIKIISTYTDSPAEAAGILPQDLIVSVDGEDVKSIGYLKAMEKVKGEAGTTVKLVVRRGGQDSEMEVSRKQMEIPTVEYRMEGQNGYIKISSFKEATIDQFNKAIDELTAQGAQGLIFDLRENSGGTLDSVSKMLDKLLPEGVIATKVKADGTSEVLAESDAVEINLPMVTIGNKNTASAAELFICALRDYDKAKLVGTTTYGKGVMQELHTLKDGSAINLTTGYFNPPKSENFNNKGITPDFEVKLTEDQQKLFDERALELENDPQFTKAVEVLNTTK
ncbi:peptidase, S41 family [[Clostridium] methylpentosum DSM 5476]|uniref:Peptidase, S41 family n=1 Tax=[Clostridium] methylpentosum DSM 5476 TaxID=537013 RepID=C0EB64_9FIRM|nr:peptidase, S41 family [[Clostridium] methylpentosum DSM 5476]MDY3988047.1 S41 family peptidase [Massilioclostridium sp.]